MQSSKLAFAICVYVFVPNIVLNLKTCTSSLVMNTLKFPLVSCDIMVFTLKLQTLFNIIQGMKSFPPLTHCAMQESEFSMENLVMYDDV